VLPHEDVVDAVVADRQALMHALGANPEPILLTYQGGGPASDLVEKYADHDHDPSARPLVEAITQDGTQHRLWAITDPAEHARIAEDLAPRRSLVEGGYRAALERLGEVGPDHIAFAVVAGQQAWLVADPDPDLLAEAIPADRPESWRRLDATVLHLALAGRVWDVPDTADHIRFDHDARHAVVEAHRHRGLAVLMRPVAEATVTELAAAGVRMPRKSTSFAPKPATGLVMRLFDEV
jgi:uncharacterized protein (DUF1015 family)